MQAHSSAETYERIKRGLGSLGYASGLLHENYEFADILSPEYSVRRVPLAAFAQEPPSYRNACFGVVIANGRTGSSFVANYRSLGAPQILEIHDADVLRWKMTSQGAPLLLEQVPADDIRTLFDRHREDWSPVRLLKAKSAGDTLATQLDFLDLGLLPLLEREVRTKLGRLLHDTVSLAIEAFQHRSPFNNEQYPRLFRLIFRLIAAKVLADRRHPGNWLQNDPRLVVAAVQEFYFRQTVPEPVLEDHGTQVAAWDRIKGAFHFQNLSVDSLAFVYENTLVTPQTRKLFGIHSTPPAIAEYITRRLPFEDLEVNERRVFEPFSGHAVFLVAAMQRLRELLPLEMTPAQRHHYFVDMLSGIEIDDFAREVARLSLMLADYPNPDGWRLHKGDALSSPVFAKELNAARIVLCNPPFEEFNHDERARYSNLPSVHKPAAILHRVLHRPPDLLGFVLPRVFLIGRGYRELRSTLGGTYSFMELVALPDQVFQYSDAETVLLIASRRGGGDVHLRTAEVQKRDLDDFYVTHKPSLEAEDIVENAPEAFGRGLWLAPLEEVWKATAQMRRLGAMASIHRGIEYRLPFREHKTELVSETVQPGFAAGVHRVEDTMEPFMIRRTVFLNVKPEVMRTSAHDLPWNRPKLIVNAVRRTRGHWKITASPDRQGLVCYQNFHGVWPKTGTSLEVLAAILNGPVANAFIATREGQRHVRGQTLKGVPVPELPSAREQAISSLVQQYTEARLKWISGALSPEEGYGTCARLLNLIDAEVLKGYDLAPRAERILLDYFSGHSRPGPVEFKEYFPPTLKPYIPWHVYVSSDFRDAKATETLRRLPVLKENPLITEALSYVE